jgi:hypothetical protein
MGFHRTIATLGGAAMVLLSGAPAGAEAVHSTDHYSVSFTEPGSNPCDGATGTLSVEGDGVVTVTEPESAQSFQLHDNLHGVFSFDPDDPAAPSASGHFVGQHRESFSVGQDGTFRLTDTQHTIVHAADGTNFPIQIRTTLLFFRDGSFEVKVDSIKCEGQFGA